MKFEKKVDVIDCQIGNLGSVINLIKKLDFEVNLVKKSKDFTETGKIILPGVGHFDQCIKNLRQNNLFEKLEEKIFSNNNFFLGICVGMQILFNSSEEGKETGFGVFSGNIKKFDFKNTDHKVPHMGWNNLESKNPKFEIDKINRAYFCHSYYADCDDKDIISSTTHGIEFPSIIGKKKIFGFQFHPEKSYKTGENLIKQYLNL